MKRVLLLIVTLAAVFTLTACNAQKTLICTDTTGRQVLKTVYDKDKVYSFVYYDENEDFTYTLTSEELQIMNEDGLWSVFEGASHYDLMEDVREAYDNNDVYNDDWAEDSEIPEEDRLSADDIVTCTID